MITPEQSLFPLTVHKVVEKYCMRSSEMLATIKDVYFAGYSNDIDEALGTYHSRIDNIRYKFTAEGFRYNLGGAYTTEHPDNDGREHINLRFPNPLCTDAEYYEVVTHFINTPKEEIIPEIQRYIDEYIGL
jgi:hypothetical protein